MARKFPQRSLEGEPLAIRPLGNLSYSTLDSWFSCPKSVQLRKERRAPATPAWWFAGGSAVHATTEAYDRWALLDPVERPRFMARDEWERAFDEEVNDISERFPDHSLWRNAGSKEAPETYDRWKNTVGPEQVKAYIAWRQRTGWALWTTPGGQPAIELDVGGQFPGSALVVKGYLDRVFVDPYTGRLTVVDIKTGSRQPEGPLQFGVYAAGLALNYQASPAFGYAFMTRKAILGKPFPLSKYTPEYVGKLFGHLSRAVTAEIWPAHVGQACRMCDVSAACFAADGEFSSLYDPDDPAYVGHVPF